MHVFLYFINKYLIFSLNILNSSRFYAVPLERFRKAFVGFMNLK